MHYIHIIYVRDENGRNKIKKKSRSFLICLFEKSKLLNKLFISPINIKLEDYTYL